MFLARTDAFSAFFGHQAEVQADAPGCINLLGDPADGNGGFVLPVATRQRTQVAVARARGPHCTVHAADLNLTARFTMQAPPQTPFARHVYGCLKEVEALGLPMPALDLHVHSTVPMGVGLSSSASLEVAVLRAVRRLFGLDLDDVHIARLAQQAENRHAGATCGVMGPMASSLADTRQALFLDTRTLAHRLLPLPAGSAVLAIDSGVARTLAGGRYDERRNECRQAAQLLGVASLRQIEDPDAALALPEPLRRRVRHVLTENRRVLRAAGGVSAAEFGALMNESHASLRDDFAASHPAVDTLVGLLQRSPGVHGARMTGGGFGGACVALCDAAAVDAVVEPVLMAYARCGHHGGRLLVPA